MQHPDEGMIHTWLDGELPPEEATALEAHAAKCEQCKAAIAEARGFIAASSRIVSSLDAVPAGVIPIANPVRRMWYSSPQFRAAAAVLVVAGASLLVMKTGTEKAPLSVSTNSEANKTSSSRVMSTPNSPAASSSAPVQPPVVADRAAGKKESSKPTVPEAPKVFATLSAPVRQSVAANTTAAKETDFSGKGVKGGTAKGVEGAAATSATVSALAMKAADSGSPRSEAFAVMESDLKVIRVDSTATAKRTTYQSLSGSEVVLTEQAPSPALARVKATADESRQRAASGEPVIANLPAAPVPAPAAQRAIPIHTITWVDPSTRRRFSLSGPVPAEELETIKARLLKEKR